MDLNPGSVDTWVCGLLLSKTADIKSSDKFLLQSEDFSNWTSYLTNIFLSSLPINYEPASKNRHKLISCSTFSRMILSKHVYIFRVLYHFFSMPVTVLWSIREKMSHLPLWQTCQSTVPSPSNIPIWKNKKTQRHFKYHFREAFLSSPRQNEAFWPLCYLNT